MLQGINLLAVIVATIVGFLLGGLWYSPKLFGKIWKEAAGISTEQTQKGHKSSIYIITFIFSLIAAFVFAIFLGPYPSFTVALGAGIGIGLCWVATSLGINYLFAGRSWKLFLIDAGYHTACFTLYGIILGLWHL